MVVFAVLALMLGACGSQAQESDLVISSDPELGARVAELLPELARRAGMELVRPVRVERRTREELEAYIRYKLDEELPPEEARRRTRTYELLGLVGGDVDLREILLSVYTEQVAGFYDPDSTALFVMDDMALEMLEPILVHELVHAVQDQTANLDSLTAEERGNDRATAAQSAIEGHATLVMLEYMAEELQGQALDISELPNFSETLRPALEGMRAQYPALASAPAILQEELLFPYLGGAAFVGELWQSVEGRPPPFQEYLPQSTEQVLWPDKIGGETLDMPTELELEVDGEVLYENTLGQMELEIFLAEHLGPGAKILASGWDGDRFALVAVPDAEPGLLWSSVWDSAGQRDRFAEGLRSFLDRLPAPATLDTVDMEGRPGVVLRVGAPESIALTVTLAEERTG